MHVLAHFKSLNYSRDPPALCIPNADTWIHARSADTRSRKSSKFELWPTLQPLLNLQYETFNQNVGTKDNGCNVHVKPTGNKLYGRVRDLTSQTSQFIRYRWALLPWKRLTFPYGLLARLGGKKRKRKRERRERRGGCMDDLISPAAA